MRFPRSPQNDVRPSVLHKYFAVAAIFAAGLSGAGRAHAQLAASATVESQYRFQGVALTRGEPDGRIGLSYDHPSGAYGGVSLMVGNTAGKGVQPLGYMGYAGYARQTSNGINWDVGVTNADITLFLPVEVSGYSDQTGPYTQRYTHRYNFDYTEVYAGVSKDDLSARLYISPDYLGQRLKTAYLDMTGAIRPTTHLRLFMHAGVLTPLSDGTRSNVAREHFDFGPGGAWEFRHAEIRLTWSATTPRVDYPAGYPQTRNVFILSATHFF
jgi:hypothetical protein